MSTRPVARSNPHPRTPRRLWAAAVVAVGGLLVGQGTPALAANRLLVNTAHTPTAAVSASTAPNVRGAFTTGTNHPPVGSLDAVTTTPTSITVRGWALDPDTTAPIDADVYIDGVGANRLTADQSRPDVGAAYPGEGNLHGFSADLPLLAGNHQVCVYGIDSAGGANPLLGCQHVLVNVNAPRTTTTTTTTSTVFPLPAVGAVFDYQLGGAYPPASGVTVVERDSTERPAAGLYSICYVNAFQTQPGATWPEDLLLHDTSGQRLIDPNWPDENIIDISTPAQQTRVANILATTIDGCRTSGFNAVEFDNLDSYTRSQGKLTPDDALAYATLLVGRAHQDGLAAAQKNTAELAARARQEVGFDFAISEQCAQFNECSSYTTPYNNHVLDVEYTGQLTTTFTALCAEPTRVPSTILRDVNLVAAGTSGYHYQHC